MNKQEIKNILENALVVYNEVFKVQNFTQTNTQFGFCYYFEKLGFSNSYIRRILFELYVDYKGIKEMDEKYFWYEVFFTAYSKENSILPRIEHLKRTIARLKKELQDGTE